MKVGLTGGSGVVGGAVARHLVAAGHDVVVLVRSPSAAAKAGALGAVPKRGDLLDYASVASFVEGCDLVFHVGGVNEMCSRNPAWMDRVNIQGTRHVLEAVRRRHPTRVVHTSSAVTLGEEAGMVGSEATAHRGYYHSRYERSKHLSERLALDYADDVDVVVVNPSSVQGPGRATGTGKLVLDVVRGKLPFLVDARFSVVDIDDCARGHLLAAERGRRGERYVLSGSSVMVRDAVALASAVAGMTVRPRFIPGGTAALAAPIVEAGFRLARRRPPVCREMIRVLRAGSAYDGSRATRELGLEYTPVEETLRRTVEWFQAEGLLS